jgi:hypothetical protein
LADHAIAVLITSPTMSKAMLEKMSLDENPDGVYLELEYPEDHRILNLKIFAAIHCFQDPDFFYIIENGSIATYNIFIRGSEIVLVGSSDNNLPSDYNKIIQIGNQVYLSKTAPSARYLEYTPYDSYYFRRHVFQV